MSRKMIVMMNHQLTATQKKDAIENLGITDFIDMSSEVKSFFKNIDPEWRQERLHEEVKLIFRFLLKEANAGDVLLIAGKSWVTCEVVKFSKLIKLKVVYATTKRETIEEIKEDGSVVKRSVFKYVRFRRY